MPVMSEISCHNPLAMRISYERFNGDDPLLSEIMPTLTEKEFLRMKNFCSVPGSHCLRYCHKISLSFRQDIHCRPQPLSS
jgi:hypothetical protein